MIKRLFDNILTMSDDEVITVDFTDRRQLASVRTQLYREKRNYENSGAVTQDIYISQNVKELKLIISKSTNKESWVNSVFLKNAGGETSPLMLALDRIKQLKMKGE